MLARRLPPFCHHSPFRNRSKQQRYTRLPADRQPEVSYDQQAFQVSPQYNQHCSHGRWRRNTKPGEVSLSHNGVLFLDELPEFQRSVLEVMRQPLEDRKIDISRARYAVQYPAGFMLVASMNPCPCGYYNHPEKDCVCHPGMVQKYLNRISGPLLDRIDIHIEVVPVPFEKLSEGQILRTHPG
jgi:predicted ATPase with chaperone activity